MLRAQTLACAAFSLRDIMEDKCTVTVKLFLKVSLKPLGGLSELPRSAVAPRQRAKYPYKVIYQYYRGFF